MTTTTTTGRAVEAVLAGLEGHRYLNLSTFRKSGVPVLITVLFAPVGEKIYVWTPKDSGKVKRIRNNPTVRIAPSTRLGRPPVRWPPPPRESFRLANRERRRA